MSDEQKPPKRKRGRPSKDNSPTSPRAVEITTDKERAWELRAQGLSYREIGERMNISHMTAYDYVRQNSYAIENLTQEHALQYRQTQIDEIERALKAMWQQYNILMSITSVQLKQNDPATRVDDHTKLARAKADTIRTIEALLNRQAKLLGLDSPTRIETEAKEIHFVMDLSANNDTTND